MTTWPLSRFAGQDTRMTQTKEERLAYQKKYREIHRDKIMDYGRAYYWKDPKRRCDEAKIYREAHKEELSIKYHVKHQTNSEFRESKRVYSLAKHRNNRTIVINHYGGKCACCGESTYEFLAIDHINGGGTAHRREIKGYGSRMCDWLIKNNFPDGFQILCHNCNLAKGFYGQCPHQKGQDQEQINNPTQTE